MFQGLRGIFDEDSSNLDTELDVENLDIIPFFKLLKIKQRSNGFTVYVDEHTVDSGKNQKFYVVSTFEELFEFIKELFCHNELNDKHDGYEGSYNNFTGRFRHSLREFEGEDNIEVLKEINISEAINGTLTRIFYRDHIHEEIKQNKPAKIE